MVVKQSKKQVFGGLYLTNTILVLAVFTQSSIAQAEDFSRQDVLDVCNQISWRIIANNTIVDAKEGSWITDEYYSDSIRNVIGKAIADCITEKNEFKNKGAQDTITFEADPVRYSPENWNAVVLYNLIHIYSCGFKGNKDYTIDEAFEQVEKNVRKTYSTKIKGFDEILAKAMSDIKEYAKELDLQKHFYEFCDTKHNWIDNWKEFRDALLKPKTEEIQITPNLELYLRDKNGNLDNEKKRWLSGYLQYIKDKELELANWAAKADIKLKMQQISYNISNYKIMMDSVCSPYQVKMKIKDHYEKESTTVFIDQDNYTPEQKDIITVINYIITAKKPANVESIYYDAKDGWHVQYK